MTTNKKRGSKKIEDVEDKELTILDPEFTFIFTINLDGKINMRSILRDNQKKLSKLIGDYKTEPLEQYFIAKDKYFEKLLSTGCGKCTDKHNQPACTIKYNNITRSKLSYFIDSDFIQKAVLGCWELDQNLKNENGDTLFSSDHFQNILGKYSSIHADKIETNKGIITVEEKEIPLSQLPRYTQIADSKLTIKLFSNGSLSILIRLKFVGEKIKITPYNLIKLIQFPNMVVPQYTNSATLPEEPITGFLNYLAYDIANNAFNTFFKCLQKNKDEKGENIVDYIEIERVKKKGWIWNKHKHRYTILKRYEDGKYTVNETAEKLVKLPDGIEFPEDLKNKIRYDNANQLLIFKGIMSQEEKNKLLNLSTDDRYMKAIEALFQRSLNMKDVMYIQSWPYVGVMFDRPEELKSLDNVKDNSDHRKLSKLLVAVATQTKEFIKHFTDPYKYLKENSITRGSQDAIVLERRGFVACGIRHEREDQNLDRKNFLNNPFATLVFSIEAIMANVKSVNAFNKELEEYVSPAINDMLHKRIHLFHIFKIRKLYRLVSKARALSPCEDFSSNIIPNLRSQIAIEGSLRIQKFALNILIESVRHRLENFGHFLRTTHESLNAEFRIALSILMVIIAYLLKNLK